MRTFVRFLATAVFIVTFASGVPAFAQETVATSQLDELLNTPISTAAKYEQQMSEVAASVTVITAEEIARYGWHTLADALNAVRGVYTTHDHGYTYLGVRGLGLPTDYNNRILVLVNGTPLTETVSGSVGIDTTLAIDLSHLERIEFVHGPGSVLYGTGAMFGVINLITKSEKEQSSVMAGVGSDGLRTSAARTGFSSGALSGSVAASWQERDGGELYFREFDSPETNGGIAKDRDYDDYESVMGTLRWRDVRVLALHSSRTKGVPTASWGTVFGADEQITDSRTMLALGYHRRLDPARALSLNAYYDHFGYKGVYPAEGANYLDRSESLRLGGSLQYVWDIRPNHRLTLGGEAVRNRTALYRWGVESLTGSIGAPYTTWALYAQAESHVTRRLTITAGASIDHHPRLEAEITPRFAAIFRPSSSSTVKALYGRAFRVPSIYEFDYESDGFPRSEGLEPESLQTVELVWEQRIGSDVLGTLSLFRLEMDDVIRLQTIPEGVQHQNIGHAHSNGAELRVDHRTNTGIWSYANVTVQKAQESGGPRANSPERMVKAGISTPTAKRIFGGAELQYESGRLTLTRQRTDDILLANLNLGVALTRNLQLTTTVRNLFDTSYGTPGGPEHRQDVLQQDGRSVLVRLRLGRR